MTDPDASSELRPKSEQEIVGVVSFNHWFQALSRTICRTLGMLLFLADVHHHRLPDTEVCHQQDRGYPAEAVIRTSAVMITIQIRVKTDAIKTFLKTFQRCG